MKKTITSAIVICMMAIFLTGCEDDLTIEQEMDLTGTIVNETQAKEPEEIKAPEMTAFDAKHTVAFNGTDIPFITSYALSKERAANWAFTVTSNMLVSIRPEIELEGYDIIVTNVYADISTSSQKQRYNGIRQDSMNLDYTAMPTGGIAITSNIGYSTPFQIEAVDKNETFFYVYNGWGSSSSDRVSERKLGKDMNGAILNTVWTITFRNKETGVSYMQAISDKVKIPYNRQSEE